MRESLKIALKSFIVILLLIIMTLIFIIFNQNKEKTLSKNNTNIAKQEIKNSKTETNHEFGKIYEKKENIITEKHNSLKKDDKTYTSYTKDFINTSEYVDEFIYSENGELFGWEEGLFGGCSSWCSVKEYNVNVKASSTLKPHGKYSYSASNIQDIDKKNAWVEGIEGDGIGEYLEIEQNCLVGSSNYKTDIGFVELCIVNGYAATEKNWNENNRVKELKMYFDNKYITTIVLEDTIKQQYIDISEFNLKVQNGETAKFKFEINDIYKGTKYDDTCVTGLLIEFTGRTGH